MKDFNRNIQSVQPSRSMVMMAKANAMKAVDPEIIGLTAGEPDFATPDRVCMEALRWLGNGYTHYTSGNGLPELRERIARKLLEDNGCAYTPEQVMVTTGGKYAIYLAVRTLVNPGDEVIYLNPGWVSYPSIVEASGATPVPVLLDRRSEYRITAEALEKAASDRTRALIINYPNNPTGRVLHPDEMAALKAFMLSHPDVWLISDEIYESIVYDGVKNISPASDPELAPRVVTINGFSKSAAMTGWRLGYLAAPDDFVAVASKLYMHTLTCVSGFMQKAAITALDCHEETEAMRRRYAVRREAFCGALNSIPGVSCALPEGAFYAWAAFDIPGMDSEAVAEFLLREAKVVGVPGIAYGEDSAAYVRFSFAAADDVLARAAANIRAAMERLVIKA